VNFVLDSSLTMAFVLQDEASPATDTILGTPLYMAPEQFKAEPTDARTDQFSFAVALYESLFGEFPFHGQTLQELCAAVLAGTPRSLPRDVQERVPPGVHEALLRALSRNPADRFPTLLVMLREIERSIDRASGRNRRPIKVVAGAIGFAAVAAVTWFVLRGHARHAPSSAGAASPLVGLAGKCIDASGGTLELRTCSGVGAQTWRLASGKLLAADGRCVGTRGGSSDKHAALELQRCNDDASQAWQMRGGLLVAGSGLCANVEKKRTQEGTPIILWDCNDRASNEHWRFGGGPRSLPSQ
jgi:hypothetical protein